MGAGPGGLATAIELARLVQKDHEAGGTLGEVNIAVLDKASGRIGPDPMTAAF